MAARRTVVRPVEVATVARRAAERLFVVADVAPRADDTRRPDAFALVLGAAEVARREDLTPRALRAPAAEARRRPALTDGI